jgi:hypothetical protein
MRPNLTLFFLVCVTVAASGVVIACTSEITSPDAASSNLPTDEPLDAARDTAPPPIDPDCVLPKPRDACDECVNTHCAAELAAWYGPNAGCAIERACEGGCFAAGSSGRGLSCIGQCQENYMATQGPISACRERRCVAPFVGAGSDAGPCQY